MSQTIDSKVVEMSFDNRKFEQNVSTSLSTIDKLKKSLNFDGMTKGFDDLSKSASRMDFSPVGEAIDTVKIKFSALQIAAFEAMRRMTSAAIDAGVAMVKSLSVDNIAAGWSKFEQKTQSVGTLIAQGYDLNVVEEQLSKLAWFTDETSYEFTSMVESIAKFTAAGQTLPDSVQSLMGIANWAALSGQNAQTASRAMYQLSQAMGSGVMRKEDYKSIQNVSMDTVEFRQKALDAAVALGTLKKNADGTYTSIVKDGKKSTFTISQFADNLTQEAWFTTDVMKEVYKDYAGAIDKIYEYVEKNGGTASAAINALMHDANSGLTDFQIKAFKAAQEARTWSDAIDSVKEAVASTWLQTFEIIFGNYEEAKELWTNLANEMYNVFAEPGNERNNLLESALKSTEPYLDKFVQDTFKVSQEATDNIRSVGDDLGYSAEELKKYIASIADGDKVTELLINGFYQIEQGAKISQESISQYVQTLAGMTEEEANALLDLAFADEVNTKALDEMLKKVSKGNEEIEAAIRKSFDFKNVDLVNYIQLLTGSTEDQVKELRKFYKTQNQTTDALDEYIDSLAEELPLDKEVLKAYIAKNKELDPSKIMEITGANEDQVKSLISLVEAESKNTQVVDEMIEKMANGDEVLEETLRKLLEMNDELYNMSGRSNLIKAFWNVWNYGLEILNLVKESFAKVFPPTTADTIYDITKRILAFTEGLSISEEVAEKVGNILSGIFSIFKIAGQFFKAALIPVKALIGLFQPLAESIFNAGSNLGEWLTNLAESGVLAEKFTEIFTNLVPIITEVFDRISKAGKTFIAYFKSIIERIRGHFDKLLFNRVGGGFKGAFYVITEYAKNFIKTLINVFGNLTGIDVDDFEEKFLKVFNKVRNFIAQFIPDQEQLTAAYEKFREILAKIKAPLETIGNWFKAQLGKKGIKSFSDLWAYLGEKISAVKEKLKPLKTAFDGVKTILAKVWEFAKKLAPAFASIGKFTFSMIGSLTESVAKFINNIDFSHIFDFINGSIGAAGVGGVGYGIMTFLTSLSKPIKSFKSGFLGGIVDALDGLKDTLKSYQKDINAKTILKIAAAIGILAVSLLIMSKIETDKLMHGLGAIAVMLTELGVAFNALGGKGTHSIFKKQNSIQGLVQMAASILILAVAMRVLAKLEWPDIWKGLTAIGMLMLELTVMANALDSGNLKRFGITAIEVALSMLIFARAIKKIAEFSWNEILKGIVTIGAIMLELSIASQITDPKGLIGFGMSMILVGASMHIFASAMKKVAEFSWNDILKGIVTIGAIMLELSIASQITSPLGLIGFGTSMVLVGASMLIFAASMQKIAAFSWNDILKGIATIGAIMLELSIASQLTDVAGMFAFTTAILAVAVSMAILYPILNKFAGMSYGQIVKSLTMIAGVFGLIVAAGYALKPVIGVILLFSAALVLMGASVIAFGLGLMTISLATTAFAASAEIFVGALVQIITGLITALPNILGALAKSLKSALPSLIELISSIVTALLGAVKEMVPELVDTLMTVLMSTLDALNENMDDIIDTVLEILIKVLNGVADSTDEIVEALLQIVINAIEGLANKLPEVIQAVVDLVKALFEGVVQAMGSFGIEDLTTGVKAVEDILLIMTLLSGAGLLTATAMAGVLGIGSVIAELLLVLAALGGLAQIPGLDWLIGEGGDLLQLVGEAIGKFLGGIGGELLKGVSSGLPEFGDNLSKFMDSIGGFVDGASNIDDSIASKVGNLTKAITALIGAEFLSVVSKILTLGIGDDAFGEQLQFFADALVGFSNTVSQGEFDVAKIDAATGAAVALAGLQSSLYGIGGVIQWFCGDKDLSEFGNQIADFATGLMKYCSIVNATPFNIAQVEASVQVGEKLAELQSSLEPMGGVVDWFVGAKDLGEFGDQAARFGLGIAKYCAIINSAKFNPAQVLASVQVGSALAELQDSLEPMGGVVDWIVGVKDLGSFGEQASKFASGLVEYCSKISGATFNVAKVRLSIQIGEALGGLQSSLEPVGGVVEWFAGTTDLGTFGDNAAKYAEGIAKFLTSVKEAGFSESDVATINSVIDITETLADLQNNLEATGGVVSWFKGDSGLDDFGKNIKKFGTKIKDFIEEINEIKQGPQKVGIVSQIISSIVSVVESLSKNKSKLKGINSDLTSLANGVSSFVKKFVDIGVDAFANLPQQARNFVEAINILLGANYANGGSMPGIVSTVGETVEQVVEILDGGSEGAGRAGTNLFTSYDNSAQTRGDEAEENIGEKVHEIGDHTVYQTDKEGNRINESIMLWGEDGVEHLNSDEVMTLFGDTPRAWVATMIGSATGKSPEFYDTLRKLARNGSASMTAKDILTLYNEGGIELVQALIDGGSLKASDVTDKLREAILGGVKNGDVLNEGILKAYFDLGGRLDSELAKGLAQGSGPFAEAIKNLITNGAGSLSTKDLVEMYKKGGKGLIDDVISGWGGSKTAFKETVTNTIKEGKNVDANTLNLYHTLGGDLDARMIRGMDNKRSDVASKAKDVVAGANKAAEDEDASYSKGQQYSQGYADGIKNKASKATEEAKKMVQAVNKIISSTQMSQSPSRVAKKFGEYYGEGYAIGITNTVPLAEDAAEDTVKTAIQAMSDSLSALSKLDFASVGDDLTIRPVMDLSEIQNGVNQIGTMMNGVDGYAISGSMDSAWAAAASMGFTGSTNPQQDSIDKLNQTVKELANRPPKQITQNYTIVSDDPEEIYEYISTRMQNDVVREDSIWA